MDCLNSVLIEGVICNTPEVDKEKNRVRFTIKSKRKILTREGKATTEESRFNCECYGVFTQKNFIKLMSEGRGIRVVGRLKQYTDCEVPYVVIVGENLEVKLKKGSKNG